MVYSHTRAGWPSDRRFYVPRSGRPELTTKGDKAGTMHGQAKTQDPGAKMRSSGISDLAFLALAELASCRVGADFSEQALASATEPHVAAMAYAMADPSTSEAEALVADLLDAGETIQDLCLLHLAPAAQELGRMWENDRLPFADVAMAAARMQAVLRNLPRKRSHGLSNTTRGALFAATPGETHTLGVLMAADHFRRLDWDVGVLVGLDHDGLCRQVLADDRPILGLSCAGIHSVAALSRVVDDMRARRPNLGIVVSGAVTQDIQAVAMLPECDGIIETLDTAEAEMDMILRSLPAGAFDGMLTA